MDYILDLDVETFNELVESCIRIEYMEKQEAAWTAMIAAQGRDKDMKKWTRQWDKIIYGANTKPKDVGDLNAFIREVGSF